MRIALLITVSLSIAGTLLTGPPLSAPPAPVQAAGQMPDLQDLALPQEPSLDDLLGGELSLIDEHNEKRRRILKLVGGRFARGMCHREANMWTVRTRSRTYQIPHSMVRGVASETERVKEWRELQKTGASPAKLVRWSLDHGLLKEGLAQMDRGILSHRSRPEVLAILAGPLPALPAPPKAQPDVKAGAHLAESWNWLAQQNTTTMHWLAAENWAASASAHDKSYAEDEVHPWLAALGKFSAEKDAKKRSFALSALSHWRGVRAASDLRKFTMLDPSEGVREHAAWLLGTLEDDTQIGPMISWLSHEHEAMRTRAAIGLGHAGYPAAVPALVSSLQGSSGAARTVPHAHIFVGRQTAYVQDFDPEIANSSAIADPTVNVLVSGAVLDVGVLSITIERHRTAVRRSLHRITGHQAGSASRHWTRWLEKYPTVDPDWRAPWPSPESMTLELAPEPANQ